MSDEELLAECQERGLLPMPRDPNGELRANWEQMHHILTMAESRVESGARLIIKHPACFAKTADMKALARAAIVRKLDAILASAIVQREAETADAA